MYVLILSTGHPCHTLYSAYDEAMASARTRKKIHADDPPVVGIAEFYGDAADLDRAIESDATVYHLPAAGSGCRPSDDPFLALATRVLGSGIPLDALSKADGEFETWQIEYPDYDVQEIEDDATGESAFWAYSDDGDELGVFDDEYDARDAIYERRREDSYCYPWAWNWAYCLTDYNSQTILDMVNAAGFVVAKHTPSDYYFCGIDGGGYDFKSAHHVKLGAALAIKWGDFSNGVPVGPLIPLVD